MIRFSSCKSVYREIPDDPQSLVLDPAGLSGDEEGLIDITEELQRLIDEIKARDHFGIVFLPEGRYSISRTILIPRAVRLIGAGEHRPEIILKANTPGYQEEPRDDKGQANYMVWFTGALPVSEETLKEHPDTTARGAYVNSAPYTKMQLCYPPFGVFDLDTSITAGASSIDINCKLDFPSGKGILEVICNSNNLVKVEAQVGVPIQLAQVSRDYLGALTSIGSMAGGIVSGAMTGNIGGVISSVSTGIGNSINALMPRAQSIGGGGSYAQLFTNCRLEYQWFRPVDDDNSHNGRPLCQVKTPASLGGYMLIQDGDVAIDGTAAEADEIRTLLQTGFYYE